MKSRTILIAVAAVLILPSMAYAGCNCPKCAKPGFGVKATDAIAAPAQSAVNSTACIAQATVTDTASAPMTAIQATKDTANTAFNKADAAIRSFTGDE
jgi:hypothetical protein